MESTDGLWTNGVDGWMTWWYTKSHDVEGKEVVQMAGAVSGDW